MENKQGVALYTNEEIEYARFELLCMTDEDYEVLLQQTAKKIQEYLVNEKLAKSFRELKKLPRIAIKGKDNNGKERLISRELRSCIGTDIIEQSEGFNTFYPKIKEGVIRYETESDTRYLHFNVVDEDEKSFDMELEEYIFNKGMFYLYFKTTCELDILYITIPGRELDIKFRKWYLQLEIECNKIQYLDEEQFQDFECELESKLPIKDKMSIEEAKKMIDELSDEETKFRLNIWLQYGPEIYNQSVVDVSALSEYSMFVYENECMVVFESFKPKNRYYVFGMPNGIDDLLVHLKEYTKNQMANSEYYIERGNHVKNKNSILAKIDRLFT